MLWIAIHLPDLPLQVFCRADPGQTPLVVCAAGARRVVLAANAAAMDGGIAAGCSLASALALTPHAVVRERSPQAEEALLTELAGWTLQFTPKVSIDVAHQGVVLDIAASVKLFGGLEALQERIAQGLRALGVDAVSACAPIPLAAMWLARSAQAIDCTTLDALPSALARLPLDCVIDDTATLKLFSGIGCETLGDCMQLPRAGLAQRGRQAFLAALDRALGRLPDPRPIFEPPPRFDCRIELPCEMVRSDALLFGSRRMLSSLAGTLAARQASVERFELIFEHEDIPATTLTIHLGAATRNEARFALLVREHLSAKALPAPALAIRLHAAEWLHAPGTNHTLFADLSNTHDERAVLIARLVARLGDDAVSQLQIHADHRPECSTLRVPPGTGNTPHTLPRPRPLWLLDEPRCIGMAHRLTRISGPERIEAGWWDGFTVARDYYIARDENGALLWVFQQLSPPHEWFVHGLFS